MNEKKRPYEKPAILNSESLEAKAVLCTKTDVATCTVVSTG